ncbi:hypothetical protein [Paracoccus xiamenensis]|uniref:hypothetical protein n=1 Tax=Paracoccus xiamenensis TaxID=2714901 RepID=UPI00140E6398|nr:hypothetical protein [Paracoccus xiamenensis]NHF71765.1 hypothetical protein [Paracoccus xiamenensis]
MTMTICELSAAPKLRSPLARLLQRIALWDEDRHQRRLVLRTLDEIPDHLRKDIGLDGGAGLRAPRRAGRTFIRDGRADSSLSDWRW